jgi:beta-lactamase regulating signal transducer with metallopeptidase domain
MASLSFLLLLTIRASLVLAAAGLLALALRRASAARRHLIWATALAGVLVLPLANAFGPRWTLPILPGASAPASASTATHPRHATSRTQAAGPSLQKTAPNLSEIPATLPPAAAFAVRVSRTLSTPMLSTADLVLGLWLLGLIAVAAWLVIGLTRLRRLAGSARTMVDPGWQAELDAARSQLALARPVRLLSSAGTPVPLTWGTIRPIVLLPDGAERWGEPRRRVVLLHELAHVRRHDCLAQRLARIACAIHWFNPLVWLAARQLARERERACDELVLACGTRPSDYAEQLLSFARPRGTNWPAAMAMPMARTSQIEARLRTILSPRAPRPSRGAAVPLSLFLTVGAIVLAIATVQPVASAAPRPAVDPMPGPAAMPTPQPTASPTPQPPATPTPQPPAPPSPVPAQPQPASPAPSTAQTFEPRPDRAIRHHRDRDQEDQEDRDRQERLDRAMEKLSRTLQRKLDRLQPMLDNLRVHVDIRDEHGHPVDPKALAQAVHDALKDADLARLAGEAAAEASIGVTDAITDAVNEALKSLPEALEHLQICLDDSTSCPPHEHK